MPAVLQFHVPQQLPRPAFRTDADFGEISSANGWTMFAGVVQENSGGVKPLRYSAMLSLTTRTSGNVIDVMPS